MGILTVFVYTFLINRHFMANIVASVCGTSKKKSHLFISIGFLFEQENYAHFMCGKCHYFFLNHGSYCIDMNSLATTTATVTVVNAEIRFP